MSEAYTAAESQFCTSLNAVRKNNSTLANLSKDKKEAAIGECLEKVGEAERALRQLELEVAMINSSMK
jgi:hypothetical protein